MKKIVLSTILASSLLVGAEYNYEITPMIGYIDSNSKLELDNHPAVGIGVYRNMNDDCMFDQLELALFHSNNVKYDDSSKNSDSNLIMANIIKNYQLNDTFGLYALAGLGYQHLNTSYLKTDSEGFFNYGIGTKISLIDNLALKFDVRHLLRFDGRDNILYTLGFAIAFGEKAPLEPTIKEAQIPKDSDNDGVINAKDQCPDTPAGVEVDTDGCEIIIKAIDLGIVFDTDSAKIKSTDLEKFEKFVAYAKKVSDKGILIEAHTDDVGSAKYNMGLSHRRAMSAKKQLVEMGIDEKRITTKGYGESKPKVENTTAQNRQINRRVEGRIVK